MAVAHDSDFYGWTREQADQLRRAGAERRNDLAELDWLKLAEEIELLGISLERELCSRYQVLLMHLLKWIHQPGLRGSSWRRTIRNQRTEIARILRKNPGLRPKRPAEFAEAYPSARADAADETGLPLQTFPADCPFTLDQVEDQEFWPDAAGSEVPGL